MLDKNGASIEHKFNAKRFDDEGVYPPDYADLVMDERASKRNVTKLASELLNRSDIDVVISDVAKGSGIITHQSARGRNDLKDKNLATILQFPSPELYSILNLIAQKYGITDLVDGVPSVLQMHYSDMLSQALGRNRGMRRTEPQPFRHIVVTSRRLYHALGGSEFTDSCRYRLNQCLSF